MHLRTTLNALVESPEPSSRGSWYVVDIDTLKKEGYQYVEIHFDWDDDHPNDVRFTKDD